MESQKQEPLAQRQKHETSITLPELDRELLQKLQATSAPLPRTSAADYNQISARQKKIEHCKITDSNLDRAAYSKAAELFELGKHDVTDMHLMALTRNEILHYGVADHLQDFLAEFNLGQSKHTIGHAQISTTGVGELRAQFPELDSFLIENGYENTDKENRAALLDSSMIPIIVAAKAASVVDFYLERNIPVTPESVFYGYNADVYMTGSDAQGHPQFETDTASQSNKRHLLAWPGNDVDLSQHMHEVVKVSGHVTSVMDSYNELQHMCQERINSQ